MKPSFSLDFSVNESTWDRAVRLCSKVKKTLHRQIYSLCDVDQGEGSSWIVCSLPIKAV